MPKKYAGQGGIIRAFIAGLGTETNVYAPFPTGRRAFETFEFYRGDASRHPATMFSGPLHIWRQEGEARGWTICEGLLAFAQPSGLTVRSAYESLRDELLNDLRKAVPVDLVLLNLHGAMIADGYDDCEGDLLARVRDIVGAGTTIGAELDLHCHLSDLMIRSATALVMYKEYPHTDPLERAKELFTICADSVAGKIQPVMARYDCRMMGTYRTPVEPMKSFVERMKYAEGRDGILSVSLAHGFAFADVAEMGTQTLVVADGDVTKAEHLAKHLGEVLFSQRTALAASFLTADEALLQARKIEGTVVIADRADNPGSGAPGDATFLLRQLLNSDIRPVLYGIMWDPIAVQVAEEAGAGALLALRLGGKSGKVSGDPLDLRVKVRAIAPNARQSFGPITEAMGTMVWLSVDGVDIVVNTRRQQTFHPDAFRAIGIEPADYRLVIVKSAQHFYDGFAPIAKDVLYVTTPGAAEPDFNARPYSRRIYPFWPKVLDPFK
jgi:microcystin degradation protein MlrC